MLGLGERNVGVTTAINQDICGRTATNYTQKSVNGSSSKLHEAVAVDVAAAGAGGAEGQRLLPSVPLMCNIWWIVSQVSPQPFYLISGW
jgi:Na+/serine symporter